VPVDTIIVARSSIPLIVAVMEYLLKWRELPTVRSWAALIGAHGLCCPDHMQRSADTLCGRV